MRGETENKVVILILHVAHFFHIACSGVEEGTFADEVFNSYCVLKTLSRMISVLADLSFVDNSLMWMKLRYYFIEREREKRERSFHSTPLSPIKYPRLKKIFFRTQRPRGRNARGCIMHTVIFELKRGKQCYAQ